MELRSEKKRLREQLKAAGINEDNMNLEEMREVAQAMEMSTESRETAQCLELERALWESEIDFKLLVNSTMILDPEPATQTSSESMAVFGNPHNEQDLDSPPSTPIHFEVHALVHHAMNWSPNSDARPPGKRQGGEIPCDSSTKRTVQSGVIERETQSNSEVSLNSTDSGVSNDEFGTLSSISEHSTIPSIGEVPSRLLISTSSAVVSDLSDSNRHSF